MMRLRENFWYINYYHVLVTMMPPRIVKHYYDFYKSMDRYGLELGLVRKMNSKELLLWYQFHKHLNEDYSRVMPIDEMSHAEVMELKDTFDIHCQFQVHSYMLKFDIGLKWRIQRGKL